MGARARQISAELRAAWAGKLRLWWQHYNELYLRGALRPPLIELGEAEGALGSWNGERRLLRISAQHIERDPWLEVMETLRHEMAHQYAGEVLQAHGEQAHGQAFQRACEKLRCSPRASAQSEARVGEDERVLRVLKKVLSLASSPNEHEAEAAVRKARRLLLEYNIDVVELDRQRCFSQRPLGPIKARRASYELWLALILQEFFFVEAIWVESYRPLDDKSGTLLQIYGTSANLDMAAYVYEYLSGVLERLWKNYRAERGLPGNRERQRYWAGVLEGFYHKLRAQESVLRAEGALVWKGDGRLEDYYRYHHPRVRTRSGGGVTASAAYRDGLEDGRRVSIRRPVSGHGGFGGYIER